MTPEVRKYSIEEYTRLTQFARGVTILKSLQDEEENILDGGEISLKGDDGSALLCDRGHLKIFKAAVAGMFTELLDLGLKDEIRLIMEPTNPVTEPATILFPPGPL